MKYCIVTVIKGPAAEYQQNLLHNIAKKFAVSSATLRKPAAHITLKYSFETNDIESVEACVERFSESHYRCEYRLKGVGFFDRSVIFIDVIPSKEMNELYEQLIKELHKIKEINFKKFDGQTHFHVAVAHTDIEQKFDQILSFVSKESPDFSVKLDNLTIWQLIDGVWKTYKEFSLQNPFSS